MKSFSVTTENRKNMIIMADYIDKEAALSLVQPDEPEDEKKLPLQSQLPKKNSFGALYSVWPVGTHRFGLALVWKR